MPFENFLAGLAKGYSTYLNKKTEMAMLKERRKKLLDIIIEEEQADYNLRQKRRPAELARKIEETKLIRGEETKLRQKEKDEAAEHVIEQFKKLNPGIEKDSEAMKRITAHAYGFANLLPGGEMPQYLQTLINSGKWQDAIVKSKTKKDRDMVTQAFNAYKHLETKPQISGGMQIVKDAQGNVMAKPIPGLPTKGGSGRGGGKTPSGGKYPSGKVARVIKMKDGSYRAYDTYGNEITTDLPETNLPEQRAMEIDKQLNFLKKNYVPSGMTIAEFAQTPMMAEGQIDELAPKRFIAKKLLSEQMKLLRGILPQGNQPMRGGPSPTGPLQSLYSENVGQPQQTTPEPSPLLGNIMGRVGRFLGGSEKETGNPLKDVLMKKRQERESTRKKAKLPESWSERGSY